MFMVMTITAMIVAGDPPLQAERPEAPLPEHVSLTNALPGGSAKPASINEDGLLRRLLLFTRPETIAAWSERERREADAYLKEQARLRAANGPRTVAQAVAAGDADAVIRLGGTMSDYLHASLTAVVDDGTRERIKSSIDSSPPGYLQQPAPQEHGMPSSLAELEVRLRGE